MTVLVTKKKKDALASVERDRGLLTDKAAAERSIEAEPAHRRKHLEKVSKSRAYLEFRMKNG